LQISPERIDVAKTGKAHYKLQPLPRWEKESAELWSTIKKVIGCSDVASNFYAHHKPLNCITSRICGTGRPHVWLCPIFL